MESGWGPTFQWMGVTPELEVSKGAAPTGEPAVFSPLQRGTGGIVERASKPQILTIARRA